MELLTLTYFTVAIIMNLCYQNQHQGL